MAVRRLQVAPPACLIGKEGAAPQSLLEIFRASLRNRYLVAESVDVSERAFKGLSAM